MSLGRMLVRKEGTYISLTVLLFQSTALDFLLTKAWYDRLPRNSIHSFDDMMRKFLSKYFPPSMVTKLRNEITKFEQKPHESLFKAWERYKLSIDRCPNHNMLLVTQIDTFYNGLTLSHRDTINAAAGGTFMQKTPEECYELIENMTAHHNHWDTSATRDETSRNISSTTTTESPEVVRQLCWDIQDKRISRKDIITNGDQATTNPASSTAPKTSLAANARRNNEKALNILLSAIPDRHFLSYIMMLLPTMIRGQPGLDELDFDDLYNNLKVYEHELKGVSNSSSQNIAFLSTEVKGSTLKQSTADPAHIPKGYTQAASSKVQTAPNCASHSDEIICSFFAQQASMPTTHDDEDLLQIDEDAMEEIDIRWQVAMITARIRKFMRKTGRPIDLKPKNGITFDKSKIECFNCQKLGHFARECRFAKYQENRANGRQEKRIVAIEDPNSKALVATDNNEDIDWTKEFDAEPVTFAMMALTELKVDDWSMEFDSEHRYLTIPNVVNLIKSCLKAIKLKETIFKRLGFGVESSSSEDSDNSSGNTNSTESLYPNFQKTKGFHAVPPPTGTVIPPRANVSFTGIDELAIRNKVVNQEKTKSSQPEIDRNKVIIEDWVDSDDEETVLNFSEIQNKTILNSENSETSFENRSPKSQDSVGQESRKKGVGHKGGKTCFVCYSPDHLIKDCNLHERTFKQTQTHKPKGTQGSRDTRPVWNNIKRVNHSNFSGNSRYPHQKKSFIPSAVLTREGLKSTARPKMTQSVPSKSTVNVFYQGTARPRVPHAVLSQSTGRPYYPRMDTIRPRTSSFPPSTRSSTTRTPYRPQRPKKIMKSIWVKKGSTVGSYLTSTKGESPKGSWLRSVVLRLWCVKGKGHRRCNMSYGSMRCGQYIAITDHILWDIITNGDQATTDPASSSAPKTSLAANARKKQREALNILLSVIGEAIFSVFHDAGRCKELYGSTLKPTYAVHLCLIHDDEDLLQIDEDAIEEIGIRWQVAMIEAHKSLGKDEEGEDVDVHLYRSMIGCLMYLTASRPDIMFAVCLCARFQVTPKVSHLHAVKRIFRYLKHQPKLGLWYPKDSPFHLEAFSDSDYAGDNHDRRSTSGGCQYLGRRLVSWQCKKQTIVAISSTEAEYVAAASCCAQVLWMQNQLLDYGFNFMNTEIHIDNESTICIVRNPVLHSKTKHIQIRHHFIRDCYEQRLINVVKVHTDDNVADLLTKGFDLARFNFLVVTIGMMNP
ncbi:putative ribonuclease H-like domain-containing protein [Tanacetum coccineum]|uniref:Ribonuclease H-like domain-containing protein n=1 Tax=Tanacetum coccineum TaxID=301880 RepID=A0ABQ5CCE7_9ASTR